MGGGGGRRGRSGGGRERGGEGEEEGWVGGVGRGGRRCVGGEREGEEERYLTFGLEWIRVLRIDRAFGFWGLAKQPGRTRLSVREKRKKEG